MARRGDDTCGALQEEVDRRQLETIRPGETVRRDSQRAGSGRRRVGRLVAANSAEAPDLNKRCSSCAQRDDVTPATGAPISLPARPDPMIGHSTRTASSTGSSADEILRARRTRQTGRAELPKASRCCRGMRNGHLGRIDGDGQRRGGGQIYDSQLTTGSGRCGTEATATRATGRSSCTDTAEGQRATRRRDEPLRRPEAVGRT